MIDELEMLRETMRADDERLHIAGERVGLYMGCDTPDWMADEIIALRRELAAYKQAMAEMYDPEVVEPLEMRVTEILAANA